MNTEATSTNATSTNAMTHQHPGQLPGQRPHQRPGQRPGRSLPFADRREDDVPGHWLLASMGKTVLRPGGRELTDAMIAGLPLAGADVVELAPGLGLTAQLLLDGHPASYHGIDEEPAAAAITSDVVGDAGPVATGSAKHTGLPDDSADVVVNEAMLTMNTDRSKREIIAEVARILRPGGRYAFHELALTPDDISPEFATEVRRSLARSIKVNARPLTIAEWTQLLASAGFEIEAVHTADMALLRFRRMLADEGVRGLARITANYLRRPRARKRINDMWRSFRRYRASMISVAIVARLPETAAA